MKIIKAIKDAKEYLENVADDRDNSYITYERRDEVIKILDEFLITDQWKARPKQNGLHWIKRPNEKDTIIKIWDFYSDMPMIAWIGSDMDSELEKIQGEFKYIEPLKKGNSKQ